MNRKRKIKIIKRLSLVLGLVVVIMVVMALILTNLSGYKLHKKVLNHKEETIVLNSNKKVIKLWDKTVNYINQNHLSIQVETKDFVLGLSEVNSPISLELPITFVQEEQYMGYVVDFSNYKNKEFVTSFSLRDTSKVEGEVTTYYLKDNGWSVEGTIQESSKLLIGVVYGSVDELPSFMNIVIGQTSDIGEFKGLNVKSRDESILTVNQGKVEALKEGKTFIDVYNGSSTDVIDSVEVYVTSKEYAPAINIEPQEGLTIIDGVLIVNKKYSLPSTYNPGLNPTVSAAFNIMKQDAAKLGLTIWNQSNFRSYQYQAQLYNQYVAIDGVEKADTYSARPGYSEHQTGLTIDMNTITDAFGQTAEGKWIKDNCHKYGFIVRYPEGKESITGYKYEPWHIRYLGVELATKVYDSGLTLEEYLNIN